MGQIINNRGPKTEVTEPRGTEQWKQCRPTLWMTWTCT